MLLVSFEMFSAQNLQPDLTFQRCCEVLNKVRFSHLYDDRGRAALLVELKNLLLLHPSVAQGLAPVRQRPGLVLPLCEAAVLVRSFDLMEILLQAGAGPNASCLGVRNLNYNSPLFQMVSRAHLCKMSQDFSLVSVRSYDDSNKIESMVKLLMKFGGNPDKEEIRRWAAYPTTAREMMPDLIAKIEEELKAEKAVEAAEAIALAALSMECASAQEPSRRPCVDFADDVARMLQLSFFSWAQI